MSKVQVWKLFSFSKLTDRKKNFSQTSRPENDKKFFHTFQDCVGLGTLHLRTHSLTSDGRMQKSLLRVFKDLYSNSFRTCSSPSLTSLLYHPNNDNYYCYNNNYTGCYCKFDARQNWKQMQQIHV